MPTTPDKSVVHVVAPSRLHMGFLDLGATLGRKFGGIGLSLDKPETRFSIQRSGTRRVTGQQQEAKRIALTIGKLRNLFDLTHDYHVDVTDLIPAHSGLGSGTQIAVALGMGLARLEGHKISTRELASKLGRGARSAIGIAAFDSGGFIIDGGRGPKTVIPPILMQTKFPEDWRVLLVLDHRTKGVHGANEQKAFSTLPPLPGDEFARVCHLALMQLAPGLIERDIDAFGTAISEIQRIVGRQFAPAQAGSAWTSPAVGEMIERLHDAGAVGIGQSSWGPTGFAFVPSTSVADRLYHRFVADATSEGLELMIVAGRNSGAAIETPETIALSP